MGGSFGSKGMPLDEPWRFKVVPSGEPSVSALSPALTSISGYDAHLHPVELRLWDLLDRRCVNSYLADRHGAPRLPPAKVVIAFLATRCGTCQDLWAGLRSPQGPPPWALSGGLTVVTRGPSIESAERLQSLVIGIEAISVVMSDSAWEAYRVPTYPWFVLVDPLEASVAAEGVASRWDGVLQALGL